MNLKNWLYSLAFTLASCSSGHGDSPIGPYPTFPSVPVEYATVFELFNPNYEEENVMFNLGLSDYTITVTDANTITLAQQALFGGSLTLTQNGPNSDFNKLTSPSGSFYIAQKSRTVNFPNYPFQSNYLDIRRGFQNYRFDLYGRSATVENTLVLGGKQMDLEFADFGIWAIRYRVEGELIDINSPAMTRNGYDNTRTHAIVIGSQPSSGFGATTPGEIVFTGTAVALATNGLTQNHEAHSQIVYGTARLTLNPLGLGVTSSAANQLELDFPDFYRFTFSNLQLNGNGSISGGASLGLSIEDRNNKTMINFGATENYMWSPMNGNLFGATNNPTEAVGGFIISSTNSSIPTRVDGAWGVRR